MKWAVVTIIVWKLDLQLLMQSVPITTKVMSSNPAHGEVFSIQHYVNIVEITDILLKVALNTITLTINIEASVRHYNFLI